MVWQVPLGEGSVLWDQTESHLAGTQPSQHPQSRTQGAGGGSWSQPLTSVWVPSTHEAVPESLRLAETDWDRVL